MYTHPTRKVFAADVALSVSISLVSSNSESGPVTKGIWYTTIASMRFDADRRVR